MKCLRWFSSWAVVAFLSGGVSAQVPESAFNKDPWPAVKEGPVKVFLLAGQSNMQGHAALRTLEYLIYNEETAKQYEHWKDHYGKAYRDMIAHVGEVLGNLKELFPGYDEQRGHELAGFVFFQGWNDMVDEAVWKGPDWVKFYNVGSERGYHYLGSARIYYKMGKAFGEGMIELLGK